MINFKQFSAAARVSFLENDTFEVTYTSPLTREVYRVEISGEDVIADLRGAMQDDDAETPDAFNRSPSSWTARLNDPRFKAVALRFAWEEIMPELEAEEEAEEEEEFYEEEEDWN